MAAKKADPNARANAAKKVAKQKVEVAKKPIVDQATGERMDRATAAKKAKGVKPAPTSQPTSQPTKKAP